MARGWCKSAYAGGGAVILEQGSFPARLQSSSRSVRCMYLGLHVLGGCVESGVLAWSDVAGNMGGRHSAAKDEVVEFSDGSPKAKGTSLLVGPVVNSVVLRHLRNFVRHCRPRHGCTRCRSAPARLLIYRSSQFPGDSDGMRTELVCGCLCCRGLRCEGLRKGRCFAQNWSTYREDGHEVF